MLLITLANYVKKWGKNVTFYTPKDKLKEPAFF